MHLLLHRLRVADNPTSPVEYALAFRREALKARAADDQKHAEAFLELLHTRGQGRLRDAAGLSRTSEVLFAGQRQQELELVDHVIGFPDFEAMQYETKQAVSGHRKPLGQPVRRCGVSPWSNREIRGSQAKLIEKYDQAIDPGILY